MGNECSICNDDLELEPGVEMVYILSDSESDNDNRQLVPGTSSSSTCNVTRIPCGHLFHEACLTEWLSKHNNSSSCPECRAPTTIHDLVRVPSPLVKRAIKMQGTSFLTAMNEKKNEIKKLKNEVISVRDRLKNETDKKKIHALLNSKLQEQLKGVQETLRCQMDDNVKLAQGFESHIETLESALKQKDEDLKSAQAELADLRVEMSKGSGGRESLKNATDAMNLRDGGEGTSEIFAKVQASFSEVIDLLLEKKVKMGMMENEHKNELKSSLSQQQQPQSSSSVPMNDKPRTTAGSKRTHGHGGNSPRNSKFLKMEVSTDEEEFDEADGNAGKSRCSCGRSRK